MLREAYLPSPAAGSPPWGSRPIGQGVVGPPERKNEPGWAFLRDATTCRLTNGRVGEGAGVSTLRRASDWSVKTELNIIILVRSDLLS